MPEPSEEVRAGIRKYAAKSTDTHSKIRHSTNSPRFHTSCCELGIEGRHWVMGPHSVAFAFAAPSPRPPSSGRPRTTSRVRESSLEAQWRRRPHFDRAWGNHGDPRLLGAHRRSDSRRLPCGFPLRHVAWTFAGDVRHPRPHVSSEVLRPNLPVCPWGVVNRARTRITVTPFCGRSGHGLDQEGTRHDVVCGRRASPNWQDVRVHWRSKTHVRLDLTCGG